MEQVFPNWTIKTEHINHGIKLYWGPFEDRDNAEKCIISLASNPNIESAELIENPIPADNPNHQ